MRQAKSIGNLKDGFLGQRMVYIPGATKKRIQDNPMINDLYITHIGFFPRAEGHFRKRKFGCHQYIFIYCREGAGWIEIENKRYELKSNSAFVIPPFTICSYGASKTDPWDNYWIHFTGSNAKEYTPVCGEVISIPPGKNARIEDRMILFEEMLSNLEAHSNFDNVIYANVNLKYFLTSIRQIDRYRLTGDCETKSYMSIAVSFMNNNLKKRITLDNLSEACNCSKSNLNKLFAKNMHCPPMDYFIQLKMQRACRYLANSNRKIKSIAMELGYEDQYYFSRLFSKIIGKAPSEYRNEESGKKME